MALSKIVSAIAVLIISQIQMNTQELTAAVASSATKARDVSGCELGMAIGDVRRRGTLSHIAGETFARTDDDLSKAFGVTPERAGFSDPFGTKTRLFRSDPEFSRTISDKLSAKYGPPQSYGLQTAPISWETIETIQYQRGQTLLHRTTWMAQRLDWIVT